MVVCQNRASYPDWRHHWHFFDTKESIKSWGERRHMDCASNLYEVFLFAGFLVCKALLPRAGAISFFVFLSFILLFSLAFFFCLLFCFCLPSFTLMRGSYPPFGAGWSRRRPRKPPLLSITKTAVANPNRLQNKHKKATGQNRWLVDNTNFRLKKSAIQ